MDYAFLDNLDLDQLRDNMADVLADGLRDLIEGAEEDVRSFVSEIARDMILARISDSDRGSTLEQLQNQLKIVAEINRVRVENHTWIVVTRIIQVALRSVVATALAVLL